MDAGGPPPSFQESRLKADDMRAPPSHDDGPPRKAAKQDTSSYPGRTSPPPSAPSASASANALPQYHTMDFLGNVSGGPHAAAAEALATFSSSVGEAANNSNIFVHVPSPAPVAQQAPSTPASTTATLPSSLTPQHGPPFLCPTCNTSYSRLEYLRRHERRHADIRPFACPCGKSFSRSDVLARHKTKCRVVLSGEGQAAANQSTPDSRSKTERSTPRSTPRNTRGRPSSETRARSDRDALLGDVSVDPALAGASGVDPSMQPPPPPLDPSAQASDVNDVYGYSNAPPSYAHNAPAPMGSEADYASSKNAAVAAHYAAAPPPPGNAHARGSMPMLDSKLYPHGMSGAPTRSGPSSPYTSAIHPELSSRSTGMYNSSHSSSGTNSPGTASAAPGAAPYYMPQHANGEHAAAYSQGAAAPPHAAPHYSDASAPPSASAGMYPHGKDMGRFSSSTLSPFSNTALNSNMSPYLSAFSCARDMPRMSSPRMGSSSNTGSAPNNSMSSGSGANPPEDAAPEPHS